MIKKIVAGAVTGLFLTSLVASSAFADTSAEISGNGRGSFSSIFIRHITEKSVYQSNNTAVLTEVESSAHSGGNHANGNTGGDVTIDTGNVSSTVEVTVEGDSNEATDTCLCNSDEVSHEALISGNGRNSFNSITLRQRKSSRINQRNRTDVFTAIYSKAKTGRNRANHNIDGSVNVETGNSDSFVEVLVNSSSNTLNP